MIDLRKFYVVKGDLPASLRHATAVSLPSSSETCGLLIEACVKSSVAFGNQYRLQVLLHTTDLSSDDLAEWATKILGSDKEAIEALGKAFAAIEEAG